jgi:hypothetical protein
MRWLLLPGAAGLGSLLAIVAFQVWDRSLDAITERRVARHNDGPGEAT